MQALVNPGDECVYFEPCFPMYLDHFQIAGGVAKPVPLEVTPEKIWSFDPEKLKAALSPKTKILMLNTPHNPTGKVFSKAELE